MDRIRNILQEKEKVTKQKISMNAENGEKVKFQKKAHTKEALIKSVFP